MSNIRPKPLLASVKSLDVNGARGFKRDDYTERNPLQGSDIVSNIRVKPLLACVKSLDLNGSKKDVQHTERNPLQGSDIFIGGSLYYVTTPHNWFYTPHQPPLLPYIPAPPDSPVRRCESSSESSDITSSSGSFLACSPPACITPPSNVRCDSAGGVSSLSDDWSSNCSSRSGSLNIVNGGNHSSPPSDSTSVTSEDNSKSIACLPRIIKPRKRRKKDRSKNGVVTRINNAPLSSCYLGTSIRQVADVQDSVYIANQNDFGAQKCMYH